MTNPSTIDLPVTTEPEFHLALCTLLESAASNEVAIVGGWAHRCTNDDQPDFDVEISQVTKPVDD